MKLLLLPKHSLKFFVGNVLELPLPAKSRSRKFLHHPGGPTLCRFI